MTKSDLIERLILKHNQQLRADEVEDAINMILEEMSVCLEKGDRIEIRGFGSFSLRFRAERKARNPKTGKEVKVKAKSLPYFRAGKEMRDRVCDS